MTPLAELLGKSREIAAVREKIGRLLRRQSDARRLPPILIQGETGTGKGLVSRAIHRAGLRADGPFVDVNCAAIPDTLLEAELFGFERGAFTDAKQAKPGLFQVAHRGTIFLDEVGLLPEALQVKLLTVIEERAVRRLGSTRTEPVDVWILAATSEDLEAATRTRRFREDLYHRLAVLTLWLPPLRERGEDTLLLAEHFLAHACADYDLPPTAFSPDARSALLAYRWPGNIRELANVMERVALLSEEPVVTAEMLGLLEAPGARPRTATREEQEIPLGEVVGSVERGHLLEVLRQTNWNISRAAARLGISRNTLRYRIEKHGLRPGVSPSRSRRKVERSRAPASTVSAAISPAAPAPVSIRWERRRLALLRTALVTPPGADLPPDTNRVLEAFVEKAQSFGGRVMELSPTGVVAAFGLEPIEDAPRRAALSAMAIQKAAERARRTDAEQLAVKAGIHTGQFLVGRVGGRVEIDLDAKREAWTVLEGLIAGAELDTVLVSPAAAPFLERRFELLPVGVMAQAVGEAYRLVGRERTGFGLRGRVTRFVGRRDELELLRSRLDSAVRGQGQAVGIVGDAGIGKSRLLFEFRKTLEGRPLTYLEGHCLSYGRDIPYIPVLDILRAGCGITDADTPEAMAEKVWAGFKEVGMDPVEGAPYLLHLLGLKDGTDRLAALAPEVIKARTFEILREMNVRRSRQNLLIIIVEDLYWIDKTSEEYLASLAEVVAGARILLVSTYRPGYRPPWIEKSYATQIALQPLVPEDSLSVVHSLLATDQVADSLVEVILSKAGGNPFFLEELARTVRGSLSPTVAVPDTIEEVLLARIDQLPPEGKRLLRSAAVIGKDLPFRLVQAIAEMPEEALRRGLGRLQAAEFLYETSSASEVEYTFKHALTHEVAYGSLLPAQRRDLHARITEAIEQLYSDRLAERVEFLAHHAFQGGVWGKAVTYLRQAGAKAAARSAHREAVTYFEQALVALKHLPVSRETIEQAIDVRFDLRNSLHLLGEFGRILDHLREAKTLAEALDEQRRLGWVSSYMTQYFRLIGDPDRAIESGRRALAIATTLGDFALEVATNTHLGPAYGALGDYRRAIEILRGTVESLQGDLIRERLGLAGLPSVICLTNLVSFLAELGEFTEAMARGEEAIRIAEAVDHPYSLTLACFGIGTLLLLKGELQRAIPALERGLTLCRASNLRLLFPVAASALGSAYALSGRVSEGVPLLEQAVEQVAAMKLMTRYSIFLARLGEAYVLAGRMDDAIQLATRGLEVSREQKERGHEAWALRLFGEIGSRQDPPEVQRAETSYLQAIALAEELGMRPLQAHCHLGLGKLYRQTGNSLSAKEHLTAATALFRAMDMQSWSAQSEAELRRLS